MASKLKINMISESTFTVQAHGVHTAFLEMTNALRTYGADVVVNKFRRGADITHIQTFGPYSLLHVLFGSGKKVVSVHVVPDSLVGSIAGAKHFYRLAQWYMKFFYNRADLLLAVSGMVETTLRDQLKIKKPVQLLYNTVDRNEYSTTPDQKNTAKKKLGFASATSVVVSCGQIQPRKKFDVFCDVARKLPKVQFVWIGGVTFKHLGADYEHMQYLIANKPDNVHVTGVVPHEEVRRFLQAADVFFLPSEQENHPMAVLEAAAVGMPIVVRDIPEYDDTFKDDVVRANDKTFVEIISKLTINKKYYEQSLKKAKAIAKRFDSHAGAEMLVDAYEKIIGN